MTGCCVALEEIEDDRLQRVGRADVVPLGDSLGGAFVHRLGEERKRGLPRAERAKLVARADEPPVGRGDAVRAENLLRARLVEAEGERERIAAGVRDAVELADRRDVRLAIRAARALRRC